MHYKRVLNESSPNVLEVSFAQSRIGSLWQAIRRIVRTFISWGVVYLFLGTIILLFFGLNNISDVRALVTILSVRAPLLLALLWIVISLLNAIYQAIWVQRPVIFDGNANALYLGRQQICRLDEIERLQLRIVQDKREDGADRYLFSAWSPTGQKLPLGYVSSSAACERWRERLERVCQQSVMTLGKGESG